MEEVEEPPEKRPRKERDSKMGASEHDECQVLTRKMEPNGPLGGKAGQWKV